MCPFCLATAAIVAGSATGTGGLAALVATRFRKLKFSKDSRQIEIEEDRHDHERYGSASTESGPARKVD
jgi:hypothetical protein